ncbi:NAD-dependent succinate-semialdehyde dehydrogenase [Paraburkholderia acidisoli]|uniref:Aldehyde dehydrogenase family protein n=1 Tax=Paraburkholderia acidisoli TaxID=2571748 RepID=A0A7Z2GPI9_9BURK|nr:NAD-dependent succinate-semialdehyde dehydrogenase [Paraburkholderia acidisoli]QGZ65578.1 aldehyde dehydrogenase family protein [Paraburkholderia acidisoli]
MTTTHTIVAEYPAVRLLIAGEWRAAADAGTLDVLNPASAEVVGQVARATSDDVEDAANAAADGFRVWRAMSAVKRALIMRAAAKLLRERSTQIAQLMTLEQGKPLAESRGEILAAADIVDWFAEEGSRIYGRIVPSRSAKAQQLVLREPVGPVAAFAPWNFPVNQVVRKLAAALAAGCSIVVKAPEETPASPAALIETFVDAGVPAGVIGLLYGDPARISRQLIAHPVIRKVTFTGSTAVGKQLAALAGGHMKRVTMELGGHAPVIVAEDADIERAVKATAIAKFLNAGQVCISPTRFLVHNSLRAQFVEGLARYAGKLVVGDGLHDTTTLGPLANARRLEAMETLTLDAVAKGARVAAGGARLHDTGYFFAPTVLDDVPRDASIFNDEPFGPVAAVSGFDRLDDAIDEANRLPYGLAGYAFSRSFGTIHRLMHGVEVGMLWINQPATPFPELPFGGVKDSGYGSEGGPEALDAYLVAKAVSITAY